MLARLVLASALLVGGLAGQKASVKFFGNGKCHNGRGNPFTAKTPPRVGTRFIIRISGSWLTPPITSVTLLTVSTSKLAKTVSLCKPPDHAWDLHILPQVRILTPRGYGDVDMALVIPNDTGLHGVKLYMQTLWSRTQPTPPLSMHGTSGRAAEVTIGK